MPVVSTKRHENQALVSLTMITIPLLLINYSALRIFCGVLASSPAAIVGSGGGTDSTKEPPGGTMVSQRLLKKLMEAVFKSRGCLPGRGGERSRLDDDSDDSPLVAEEPILVLLESELLRPHRDVQYFVYKEVRQISLDLLGELDKVAAKKRSADRRNNGSEEQDDDDDSDDNDDAVLASTKTDMGVVAENMCRLLMMVNYVAKNQKDLEEMTGFLHPPPVLSGEDAFNVEDHDELLVHEEDSSSEGPVSSDEEEEVDAGTAVNNKRKQEQAAAGNVKRAKKTRLIAWQQPYRHRHAHQEAWLSVLRLPHLPPRTQKRVLQHLSTYVLAVSPSPLRFAEYFTRSFRGDTMATTSGGRSSVAAILSLRGLFFLMLNHQLEYPQFYNSLYTLLHPRILYTKHRDQFLRLLSQSLLLNSMLPAYVVASFCKRLCRLALAGPPSGGLFSLALVSNLLRKHGECACLIHRSGVAKEDVFLEEVDDLLKTRGE